ncbi:YihY family inner membrane protein [Sulfurimonas sp. HSL-1716]|uniref:YihY family inner membrane protein n=1 Tax=Hydrocurvibacter sulfurireducens TaxID=3131937 RepID=UPI0031F8DC02
MNKKTKDLLLEGKAVILGFIDKELTLFAASLSFYTIFTIIPLLMIVMTLITSLPSFSEHYETIKNFIFSNLMPVNSQAIMGYIDGFLKNSVKMGVIGFASVIIASMLFFQNFEYIVNRIFHAQKRTVWESVTTYWTLITLTPIALGVSFYISGKLAMIVDESILSGWINIIKIFPYLIIWALFFLIYQIAANIKIEPKASLIASFITSTIFSIAKSSFIYYVVYNKTYATMYGSFAMVIFLFFWIYISWIIFIYGMKLCYILHRIYQEKKTENSQSVEKKPVSDSQK